MQAYFANHLDSATALFESVVREHPNDATLHAWLADAALLAGNTAEASRAAHEALRLQPCNAQAHLVRASLFMPRFAAPREANEDSTWAHLTAAVNCAPSDGNAWSYVWKYALMRGDSAMETRALRSLVETGFLTQPQITYAKWLLQSLPPQAILLTGGDLDTWAPLAIQATTHLRPDVAIVNVVMLNAAWYSRPVLARYQLRYDASISVDSTKTPSQNIVAWLRRSAVGGTRGRPLAFAIMASPDTTSRDGQLRLAGPYWLVDRRGLSGTDSMHIAESLRRADQLDWRGPAVASSDRSPLRQVNVPHPALLVAHVALLDIAVPTHRNERLAHARAQWVAAFLQRAGIDSSTIDQALKTARDSI